MSKAESKTKTEWLSIFNDWEQSGLSHKQYCDQHELSIHTFRHNKKRVATSESPKVITSNIIPIELPSLPSGSILELKLPNGTELRIPMQ